MRVVIALLDDLFFTVKIAGAAKIAGLEAAFVKTEEAVVERIQQARSLVVVDLSCTAVDPIAVAGRVKGQFPATPVIGFVSHVQTELKERALLAGCDVVLARSVFSSKLPEVLTQYSK